MISYNKIQDESFGLLLFNLFLLISDLFVFKTFLFFLGGSQIYDPYGWSVVTSIARKNLIMMKI